MSAPVTPLTVLTPSATPPAQGGASSAQSADDGFSRVLAEQRRPAESQSPAPSGNAASPSSPSATTPSDDASPAPEAQAGQADAAAGAENDRRADAKDDKRQAKAQDEADAPQAPLATLALDIAMQTAAQLRGAELRARGQAAPDNALNASRGPALPADASRAPAAGAPLAISTGDAGEDAGRGSSLPGSAQADALLRAAGAETQRPAAALADASTHQTSAARSASPRLPRAEGLAPSPSQTGSERIALPAEPQADPAARAAAFTQAVLHAGPSDAPRPAVTAEAAFAVAADPAIHAGVRPAAAAAQPAVSAPVGTPQWGPELGRQLITLGQHGNSGTHTAELRLDPPELGPLRVTLTLSSEGVAHAAFASPHASVRQAVESAMNQLQSALAQAGISLGQASVSDQGPQEQSGFGQRTGGGGANATDGQEPAETSVPVRIVRSDALVDTFA